MDANKVLIEESKLNRKILNACWYMVLIVFIISIIGLLFDLNENKSVFLEHFISFTLLPTLYLVFPLVITEGLCTLFKQREDYIIITSIFLSLLVFILAFPFVRGIQYALFIPILISALYFQIIRVYIMSSLCLISIVILYYFYEPLSKEMTYMGLFTTLGNYICSTFIAIGVINRGKYVLKQLGESIQNHQDLIVKNIIMDKASKEDSLTELYNHKTFHEYLERLIEQCESNQLSLQLAIIDIDNFKKVNDNFGHWAGDIVLKRVGEQIKAHATLNDFVSRYGGEEFAVLFTDKSKDEAYQIIEQMRISVSNLVHEELSNNSVTISIGICSYLKGLGKENFFKAADESLYQAKRSGKNQIVLSKW